MAQKKSVVGFGYKHMVCLTLSVDLHLFLGPLLGFSPQPKVALVGILSLVSVDLHLFLGPLLGLSPQPKVALVGILSLVVACVRHWSTDTNAV